MPTYVGTNTAQSGSIKTAGTTVSIDTALGTVPAGALILATVVADNLTASTPTVSSLTKPAGETNSWELVGTIDSPSAGAGTGVIQHVWKITASVAWTGHTVTATLSGSVTAKAIIVRPVWDSAASAELFVHAWAGNQTGALHLTNQMDGQSLRPGPPLAGEAVVWGSGTEDNTVFAVGALFNASGSGGSVITPTSSANRGTSGGGAASNVWALLTFGFTESYTGVSGAWTNVSTGGPTTSIGGNDGGCWIAIIGPTRQSLTPVQATRSTTWRTLKTEQATRATTWNVLQNLTPVEATRATTWRTLAPAETARGTSWRVLGGVLASRATTWDTLTSLTAERATTWDVLTPVQVVKSTTWRTLAEVVATRSTTWNVDAQLGVPQNLTATPVSPSRIDLAWTAVTGATGYDIERDGVVIVSSHSTNSYSDTNLDPSTEYDYRVRSVDCGV